MEVTLRALEDASVNFVHQQDIGYLESRYVRRSEEYFTLYLSSQTGCNRGCKFCHLTATGQTKFENATLQDFLDQAEKVFEEYRNNKPAKYVNYSFMARGEMLCNDVVLNNSNELLSKLGEMALKNKVIPKFCASTIMPRDLPKSLSDIFPIITPTVYYSIYNIFPNFRKKWMPNAMDVNQALEILKEYQEVSKKIIKFHSAFIKGENDSLYEVEMMMLKIKQFNIMGEFNIVGYNPASSDLGVESENIDKIKDIIEKYMPVKIVTRVGKLIYASCGLFYPKEVK